MLAVLSLCQLAFSAVVAGSGVQQMLRRLLAQAQLRGGRRDTPGASHLIPTIRMARMQCISEGCAAHWSGSAPGVVSCVREGGSGLVVICKQHFPFDPVPCTRYEPSSLNTIPQQHVLAYRSHQSECRTARLKTIANSSPALSCLPARV
eukprot:1145947-Pelagomonas_calceolata.AAC.7